MLPGFLPTTREASFMFDLVVVAMVVVLPVLTWSIYLVKYQKNYLWHSRIQLAMGVVLLIAVLLFELDIRMDRGWWERAMQSPYYASGVLRPFLLFVHLPIAVLTTVVWTITIVQAVRKFPRPAVPNDYSPAHRNWGKLAALCMYSTGITGWIFYWMAFAA